MITIKDILKTNPLTRRFYAFALITRYEGIKKALKKDYQTFFDNQSTDGCIPPIFYKTPDFISPSVKKAYYYNKEKTSEVMRSYVARTLRGYARYLRSTASASIPEIKYVFKLAIEMDIQGTALSYQQYIDFLWTYEGGSDELLNMCEKLESAIDADKPELSKTWLIYISTLLERKSLDSAYKLLKKYIGHYGTADLHLYYPVAHLAHSHGITNPKIKKAAIIFDVLEQNRLDAIFLNTIADKNIAVVGSSPSELGKGQGPDIDCHDLVIRFNNFSTENYENDYGKKINVWARNKDPKTTPHYDLLDSLNLIILEPDIWRFSMDEYYTETLYRYISHYHTPVVYLENRISFTKEIDTFPTTGGLLLYNLYLNKDRLKGLNLYGFSFLDNLAGKNLQHYYENSVEGKKFRDSFMHHDLEKENMKLKQLFNVEGVHGDE
ncbi:hypothetical protein F220043C3_04630 [Enterocloster asparagiformis]|uniref:glycosyltransferase family 29 protein n=1 Tax=Enterocloster asparagiformis TaxID=333367 RepID=UPI0034BA22EC